MDETVTKILSFLQQIGIPYQYDNLTEGTFLPGIKIVNGSLFIDLEKLKYPGDLLHEAGHIAVAEEIVRPAMTGNANDFGQSDGDEMAATAWSYAACKKIGLPPSVVFHPDGFRGTSPALITAFEEGGGFGYPLLYSWYMCEMPEHKQGYPKMLFWLRAKSNNPDDPPTKKDI